MLMVMMMMIVMIIIPVFCICVLKMGIFHKLWEICSKKLQQQDYDISREIIILGTVGIVYLSLCEQEGILSPQSQLLQ